VELKRAVRVVCYLFFLAFNRTIVELKQGSDLEDPGEGTSFNRTIVELKRITEIAAINDEIPLIEPLWN